MLQAKRISKRPALFGAAFIAVAVLCYRGLGGASFFSAICVLLILLVVRDIRRLCDSIPTANALTAIVANPPLFSTLQQVINSCTAIERIPDSLHRDLALEAIRSAADDIAAAVAGEFQFESTERWRVSYEQLLKSPGLHDYRSVAVVRTQSYWGSEAGIRSMQLNHQLSESEHLSIGRIVVLADELWAERNILPAKGIQEWLIEQHHNGISLWLARESELESEGDLLTDMGIYGNRAVGIQDIDYRGNTRQFTLRFGLNHVQLAEERWQRLLLYSVKYSDFLDRYSLSS